MFEDKYSVNSFEITRNDKENSSNKLKAYFEDSSFLAQQEELATFIKNLPIIRIDDLKSINKLIELLIKQNEMIGGRCQQNFITIKEFYAKHDELIKRNRNTEMQLIEMNKAIERNMATSKQIQTYEDQLSKLKDNLVQKVNTIRKLGEDCDNLHAQNGYYHDSVQRVSEVITLISERNYKAGLQKIKEMNNKSKQTQMAWINWEELETYLKEEKKRLKHSSKIKQTVEIFCGRFLKISEFVPIKQAKEQFSKEVSNLMDILEDLLHVKRKSNLLSSQSRFTSSAADYNFFQGLLDKFLKVRENDNISKEDITNQLFAVKEELTHSKRYYEQNLMKMKEEYDIRIQKAQSEVEEKNHIIEFYEGEKEKLTKDMIEFKNRIVESEQTLKAERHLSKMKQEDFANLECKLQSTKSQYAIRQRQIKQQWQQNTKTYQYKLAQKQQLIEQEQKLRKSSQQELQQRSSQFKNRFYANEEEIRKLNQLLKENASQNTALSEKLEQLSKKYLEDKTYIEKQLINKAHQCQQMSRRIEKDLTEIRHLQEEAQQNQKEKCLQSEYIKELESKSTELLMKIKSIQSKKIEQKTAKKEINAIKQTIIEQKKISREMQENYASQKQENQRLKGIIKEMKKQLQEVYLQFNHLKMIEGDRQKLISEIQKSDRVKEKLYQEYESIKVQLLKAEQENKTLMIEVRHYKNALMRIQALR